jgi:hypothetical protein
MLSRRLEVPFDRIKVEAALIAFGYGVDIDATKGSSKIWMAPSVKMGSLEIIYSLTHLPQSVINTVEHFNSFTWTSQKVERVCFAIVCEDPKQVPAHLHPRIGECLNDPVFMHKQNRCVYSVAWSAKVITLSSTMIITVPRQFSWWKPEMLEWQYIYETIIGTVHCPKHHYI